MKETTHLPMRVLFLSADEKKMAIKHLLTFSLPKAIPGCVTSMILWLRVLLMVQSVNKLIFEELMWVGIVGAAPPPLLADRKLTRSVL